MLSPDARTYGRSALFLFVLLVWIAGPLAAWLGYLGCIQTSTSFKPSQWLEKSGVLRLKKNALPALRAHDLVHATLVQDGRNFTRKRTIGELSDPTIESAFVLREGALYVKPSRSVRDTGPSAPPRGYKLQRPWVVPGWYWWTWGAASAGAALLLWRAGLLSDFCSSIAAVARASVNRLREHQQHWLHNVTYTIAVTLAITAVYREKLSSPYLVAEDGTVFLEQSLAYGPTAILTPYAGYLLVIPRLITWLGGFAPLELFPTLMVWSCLGIFAGVCYCIATCTNLMERLAIAGFLVLAPMGGYLMLSPTNIQWFVGISLVLLAVHPSPGPTSGFRQALVLFLAFLAALTGPFAIITLPAMAWRAWRKRSRFNIILAASQGFAVIVQVVLLACYVPEPVTTPPPPRLPLFAWVGDFALGLFGRAVPLTPAQETAWGLALAGTIALCFVVGLVTWKGSSATRSRLLLLLLIAGLFAAAGWVRSTGTSRPWAGGERYYVIPYALLITAIASLYLSRLRWLHAAAVILLAAILTGLHQTPAPHITPSSWTQKMRQIAPGSHGFIETYPPGPYWAVFMARSPTGTPLTGTAYRAAAAEMSPRKH